MRFFAVMALLGVVACTNSGLEDKATASTDTGEPPTAGNGGGPTFPTGGTQPTGGSDECAWVGTWQINEVQCAKAEIPEYGETYDDTVLNISEYAEGGCEFLLNWHNKFCNESELWLADPREIVDGAIEFERLGISDCKPASCKFTATDLPCMPGARIGTATATVDEETETTLVFTGLLEYAVPSCPAESFTTSWVLIGR